MIAYVRGAKFRMTTDLMLEQVGISPNVVMEFDNHEAIKTMVRLGFGVALEPASAVRADLESGQPKSLDVPGLPNSSRTTSLVLRRDEVRPPAVSAFICLLQSHARAVSLG
jgi:DNA-binding transcriptional LysR family regulator